MEDRRGTMDGNRAKLGIMGCVTVVALVVAAAAVGLWLGPLVNDEEPVARGSESYGWLRVEEVTVSGTGTAGAVSASGKTDGPVEGRIYAVHLDFASAISTTTDITITQATPALTVLQLTNYYTDTWFYPGVELVDAAGAGLSAYERSVADSRLTVAVGQTVSGTVVTARVYWGE